MNTPNRSPAARNARSGLIIGGVILLLGIITLGLSLGFLHGIENLVWVLVGLIASGALGIGYLENQNHGWMLMAAYVFLALSLIMSVWILFGGGTGLSAIICGLIGFPFALAYVVSHGKDWRALFIAAILFITAQVILLGPLIGLVSQDRTASGLLFGSSFLLALALAFVILWFPNRNDPHFAWAAMPPHVLFVLGIGFALFGLNVPQLAIPALLLYIGGVLMLRYLLHLQRSG